MSTAVAFEVDLEALINALAASFQRLPRADAEEAVAEAALEVAEIAAREGLDAPAQALVRQRARWRMLSRAEGRRDASLDALAEDTEDSTPVELAVFEVDFDAHLQIQAARSNPILALRAEDRYIRWSRALIIKALRAFLREEGHRPTNRDLWLDRRLPPVSVISRYFGSFAAALDAAGSSIAESTRGGWKPGIQWPRERCIEAVKAWAVRHGRPPTYDDARHDRSLPHPATARLIFGGWLGLRAAAGMPSTYETRRDSWPRAKVEAALGAHYREHGSLPAFEDFTDAGLPSRATLGRILGTSSMRKLRALAAEWAPDA